jgi:hypothetical protein
LKPLDELPIYESRRTPAGMWQRYLVFRDRVELRTVFGIFRIPLDEIVAIEKMGPLMSGGFTKPRDEGPAGSRRLIDPQAALALKLDWADVTNHVLIQRRRGPFKYLRFTPDDVDNFVATVRAAQSKYATPPRDRPV